MMKFGNFLGGVLGMIMIILGVIGYREGNLEHWKYYLAMLFGIIVFIISYTETEGRTPL